MVLGFYLGEERYSVVGRVEYVERVIGMGGVRVF